MVSFLEQPIFLVGAERSGTTVLRLMLSHHPDITWLNEFEYAVDFILDQNEWSPLGQYYDWLGVHRIFRASQLTINQDLSYPELINDFLVQHRDRSQKPIVGATVHRHSSFRIQRYRLRLFMADYLSEKVELTLC